MRLSQIEIEEIAGRLPSSLNEFDVLLEQFVDELGDLDAACLGAGWRLAGRRLRFTSIELPSAARQERCDHARSFSAAGPEVSRIE